MAKKTSSKLLPVIFVVVLIGLVGYLLWSQFGSQLGLPSPEETARRIGLPTTPPGGPTATPRLTPAPLKQGKETYTISQSSAIRGPKITQAVLDPLEPKKGGKQTISIKANNSSPITEVKLSLVSDNKTQTLPALTLSSGTNTDGEWTVSWSLDDSILFKYIFTITAVSSSGTTSIDLAIRS